MVPPSCPECGGKINYSGFGTQRVEEELAELLPDARILRMDQDSTAHKDAHETMLAQFARQEYVELVKILVHLVTKGTMTAGVGDLANFIFGCTFVIPAGIIYRLHNVKSRKHAVMGMAVGTVLTTIAACLMNAFVLLPAYGKAFGMPIEAFIEMGAAVNHSVNSLLGFVALIIVPFNLFKYILVSVIVFFIYKRIRVVLKGD